MRSLIAVASAILVAETYGQCTWSTDRTTYIPKFFVGMQTDVNATSDCEGKALVFAQKLNQFGQSFLDFDINNYLEPAIIAAEMGAAATNMFEYCNTTTFALQYKDKVGTVPGAFNLAGTIGQAFLDNYLGNANTLYDSFVAIGSAADCSTAA